MLGDIVESITGTTLGLYLKQHIFEPLGMKDTTLGIASDRQKPREVLTSPATTAAPTRGGSSST